MFKTSRRLGVYKYMSTGPVDLSYNYDKQNCVVSMELLEGIDVRRCLDLFRLASLQWF